MGNIALASCSNCHDFKELYLGVGMMTSTLEDILSGSLISQQAKKKVRELLVDHKINKYETGNDIFVCSSCNTWRMRFFVKIDYDDNQIYETKFKCGKCQSQLIKSDLKGHYKCKSCNNQTVTISENTGPWD